MNNKKRFLVSPTFVFITLICLCGPLIMVIWSIIDIDNPAISFGKRIFAIIFFSLIFIIACILFGFTMIQWVTFDDDKITSRNLFKKIREVKWEELAEVEPSSNNNFKWLILVDLKEGESNTSTPFNRKGKYINVKDKAEVREIIKKHRSDLNV